MWLYLLIGILAFSAGEFAGIAMMAILANAGQNRRREEAYYEQKSE